MNQQEFESVLQQLSDSSAPSDAMAQLQAMLNSAEGQQLAQQLRSQYGRSLSAAAQAAQSGDMSSAKKSIQGMLRTPEGARLAAQLSDLMKR